MIAFVDDIGNWIVCFSFRFALFLFPFGLFIFFLFIYKNLYVIQIGNYIQIHICSFWLLLHLFAFVHFDEHRRNI